VDKQETNYPPGGDQMTSIEKARIIAQNTLVLGAFTWAK
jgi:hypothetical protein